ncbi:hypothetical protein RvY_02971 [Ramazzottius varieornatus]|uniref:Uncharacterized protein n=1 Tax=Ramazzottius varieornatus TaxID=947166 RepID=A0A1D1UPX8_RAMVA|nr:hypothetical protein RvY_02971 [Ramazzottius varieornatus]
MADRAPYSILSKARLELLQKSPKLYELQLEGFEPRLDDTGFEHLKN